jgi:hypothetical protein
MILLQLGIVFNDVSHIKVEQEFLGVEIMRLESHVVLILKLEVYVFESFNMENLHDMYLCTGTVFTV